MQPEKQKRLDDASLQELVAGTAGEIGEAFFAVLVKHLARALGTRCAWVTEYLPEQHRLRALSFWVGDHYQDHYEYDVAGTPCEPVIAERRRVHVPQCVIDLYPGDPDALTPDAAARLRRYDWPGNVRELQNVIERANILRALEATHWKIAGREGAAARLGLNPNTLSSRLKALGIARSAD